MEEQPSLVAEESASDKLLLQNGELARLKEIGSSFEMALASDSEISVQMVVKLPLQFPSMAEEATFFAVMAMLDFGRGFQSELKGLFKNGPCKSLREMVLFGVMHLHISGVALDADFFRSVTPQHIEEHFQIPAQVEKQVMTAVFQHVDGPLKPLVDEMVKTFHKVGGRLQDFGFKNFGQFLFVEAQGKTANELVDCIAENFDVFSDSASATVDGKERRINFNRKAKFLVLNLYDRFKDDPPPEFQRMIVSISELDAVLVDDELASAVLSKNSHPENLLIDACAPEGKKIASSVRIKTFLALEELRRTLPEDVRSKTRELDAFLRSNPTMQENIRTKNTIHF